MTSNELMASLNNYVKFEGYLWWVRDLPYFVDNGKVVPTGYGVRGSYNEPDILTGITEIQYTREYLLPVTTDLDQAVQTLLVLCLRSAEHRVREHFTYKGRRIFGPHYKLDDLVEVCDKDNNTK
jgi:hypothetical protein